MDNRESAARCKAAGNARMMVFDWDKASRLIAEAGDGHASAGLEDDWENTGDVIFEDRQSARHEDTRLYLASIHAVPQLKLYGGDPVPCWRDAAGTSWDAKTRWPSSALAILREKAA